MPLIATSVQKLGSLAVDIAAFGGGAASAQRIERILAIQLLGDLDMVLQRLCTAAGPLTSVRPQSDARGA